MSTPYVTFPGTSGNYVSTADTNLLDSDSSHLHQSVGLWTVGALSTDYPLFGDKSLKVTGGVDTAITPATDAAKFSVYVYSVYGATFDINGSAGVAVPAATWTQLSETGPDGTYTIGCSTAADYYVGKACVRAGTDPTFVPSLNIVGDIDLRWEGALDDWTPSVIAVLVSGGFLSDPNRSWRLYVNTDGKLYVQTTPDGTYGNRVQANSTVPTAATDGDAREIRAIVDVSGADFKWYVNDVQLGSTVTPSGATMIFANDSVLSVGAAANGSLPIAGKAFWSEVRDGIDGPVVARFDAGDVAKATL